MLTAERTSATTILVRKADQHIGTVVEFRPGRWLANRKGKPLDTRTMFATSGDAAASIWAADGRAAVTQLEG